MSDSCAIFNDSLRHAAATLAIPLTDGHVDLMWQHYRAMVDANRHTNFTRITEPAAAAVKHYADSLAVVPWADRVGIAAARVVDIGTGAGFPAVPLSIHRPDWTLHPLDGTGKKIEFLTRIAADLAIDNLLPVHAHSDHWRPAQRFDVAVLRAVARLGKALRAAAPHVRRGGWIVVYKAATLAEDEAHEATLAASECRLRAREGYDYALPSGDETLSRSLRVFQKG